MSLVHSSTEVVKIFILAIVVLFSEVCMSKTLNVYWREDSKSPYDIHASAEIHATMNQATRGRLLEATDSFGLKPGLIETYKYDFDKDLYYLKLKDGLKFHNGRLADSKDLEFSLTRPGR